MKSLGGVLVGHAQQRMSEGLRDWLQASFDGVFLVGDRSSLIRGAHELQPALLIVDLALAQGDLAALMSELHRSAPESRVLLVSGREVAGVDLATLTPGLDGVVRTASLVGDLSAAVDAVLAGTPFAPPLVTPGVAAAVPVDPAASAGR